MRQTLEIEDDYRLIPVDTEIYNGGHTIIKTIEDTVIAKILYKEGPTSEVKRDLAFALAGKIDIIVDAILVTSKGATGNSIEKVVESLAIKATDFIDFNSLDKAPEKLVQENRNKIDQIIPDLKTDPSCHDTKIDFREWNKRRNLCVLYATDESRKIFVLISTKRKIVIIDEPDVKVITKNKYVSVTSEGVEVTKKSGKTIFINSDFPNKILSKVFGGLREGFSTSSCFDLEFD